MICFRFIISGFMRKGFILFVLVMLLSACSVPQWMVFSSQGIASYNRHTGLFEILWENHSQQAQIVHDTIFVDSCAMRN